MRAAIGGFYHESNSFSKDRTGFESFRLNNFVEGEELVDRFRGSHRFLGGYVDFCECEGWEIVPMIFGNGWPSAPLDQELYEYIKEVTLRILRENPVDVVLLHLHGAAVAFGYEDCEGDFLSAVRDVVGREVPVVATLDLHANVSDKMVVNATALFGFNTQPHVDMYEREQEAAQVAGAAAEGKIHPVSVRLQPPILLPALITDTGYGPMKKLVDRAFAWEKEEKVINVSPFAGFYGSDKYEIGPSAIATVDGDRALAEKIAKDMCDFTWEIKDEFFKEMMSIEEAYELTKEGGLWAIVDEADDPLGGGPADGTYILEQLIRLGARNVGVSTIRDPKVVDAAFLAGVGNTFDGMLGAWNDDLHGNPIPIHAKVLSLHNREIPFCYWDDVYRINIGRFAAIEFDGITVVVTEEKAPTENMDIFAQVGIDFRKFSILLLKGFGQAYEAVFGDEVKRYLTVQTIGICNPDVTRIGDFKKIRRPIYPLDENVKMRYA